MQAGRVPGNEASLPRCRRETSVQNYSAVHGWTSVPVAKDGEKGPLGKRVKAEFGYDDRKGVGVCDRGPSGPGR